VDQGDLGQYLYEISFIIFTLIRNTVHVYQTCFTPPMQSACVKWAKEHVEEFNALLLRQTRKMDVASPKYRACLAQAQEHAALLAEVGIDIKNLIGQRNEQSVYN